MPKGFIEVKNIKGESITLNVSHIIAYYQTDSDRVNIIMSGIQLSSKDIAKQLDVTVLGNVVQINTLIEKSLNS